MSVVALTETRALVALVVDQDVLDRLDGARTERHSAVQEAIRLEVTGTIDEVTSAPREGCEARLGHAGLLVRDLLPDRGGANEGLTVDRIETTVAVMAADLYCLRFLRLLLSLRFHLALLVVDTGRCGDGDDCCDKSPHISYPT